ncbi:MAG: rhomboid family intramembrane serine protease [Acidobacteria bacterium]|nr:rhomboid family intramembrane serine protease [Acidobacteriota bacterium]MCL5287797.1 rhomboid family intramembrane serine protease [Acidobacteriota bacterium]
MPLPPRWKWKLDRLRESFAAMFRSPEKPSRPRLCPACGTLVGSTATKCHECGASMTFSLAAASRSLSSLIPSETPITYLLLGINFVLFAFSLALSMQLTGGFSGMGDIASRVLLRLGARESHLIFYGQLWRLVMPIFLHANLMHIAFNTFVLMDIGPQMEETYGSPRYLYLYLLTGVFGNVASTAWSIFFHGGYGISVGASGSLLGLIGLMIAITTRRGGAYMQMVRGQLVRWVIYIFIFGFFFRADFAAHAGGLVAGFLLGKIFVDREPIAGPERKRAHALGWLAALIVLASFGFMLKSYFAAG